MRVFDPTSAGGQPRGKQVDQARRLHVHPIDRHLANRLDRTRFAAARRASGSDARLRRLGLASHRCRCRHRRPRTRSKRSSAIDRDEVARAAGKIGCGNQGRHSPRQTLDPQRTVFVWPGSRRLARRPGGRSGRKLFRHAQGRAGARRLRPQADRAERPAALSCRLRWIRAFGPTDSTPLRPTKPCATTSR